MPGRTSKYTNEKNINREKVWQAGLYIRLSQEDSDNRNRKARK